MISFLKNVIAVGTGTYAIGFLFLKILISFQK